MSDETENTVDREQVEEDGPRKPKHKTWKVLSTHDRFETADTKRKILCNEKTFAKVRKRSDGTFDVVVERA